MMELEPFKNTVKNIAVAHIMANALANVYTGLYLVCGLCTLGICLFGQSDCSTNSELTELVAGWMGNSLN